MGFSFGNCSLRFVKRFKYLFKPSIRFVNRRSDLFWERKKVNNEGLFFNMLVNLVYLFIPSVDKGS
jgi:hypothetical protein